jgi:hypothetical protein
MQALSACRVRGWSLAQWYALPRAEQTLILAFEQEMASQARR